MGSRYLLLSVAYCLVLGARYLAAALLAGPGHADVTFSLEGTEYSFYARPLSWSLAKLDCEERNLSLAYLARPGTARFVANSMAELTSDGEDLWIGAKLDRFDNQWKWDPYDDIIPGITLDGELFPRDTYPYWSERPENFLQKEGDQCVGIHRHSSDLPMFVVLPCNLRRNYICQKTDSALTDPQLEVTDVMETTKYSIYEAQLSWHEAVAFCRSANQIIATITEVGVLQRIADKMKRTRPVMENVWLGAKYSHLRQTWEWITSGKPLEGNTGTSKEFPPWFEHSARYSGCLLLDRHLCLKPVFLAATCNKRRGVICQADDALHKVGNEASMLSRGAVQDEMIDHGVEVEGVGRILIVEKKDTWAVAQTKCKRRSKDGQGRLLTLTDVTANPKFVDVLASSLADTNQGLVHVWLGGLYDATRDEWYWLHNPDTDTRVYFDLQAFNVGNAKFIKLKLGRETKEGSTCLNMDRESHNMLVLYGMPCNFSQAYVCYYPPLTS